MKPRKYRAKTIPQLLGVFNGEGKYTESKWVYGYYAPTYLAEVNGEVKNTYCIISDDTIGEQEMLGCGHNTGLPKAYHIIEDTVSQSIGLFDKNGKEIFKGDIVEVWVERNIQGRKQSNQDTLVKVRAVVDYGETFCNIAYYLNYDNNYNKKITQPKNKEYYDRDIQQRTIDNFTQRRIRERLEQYNEYCKTNERQKRLAEIEVIGNVWDNKDLLEGE